MFIYFPCDEALFGGSPFLQITAACLFFNNNHIKLLQLAHSYKYTERDVVGGGGGVTRLESVNLSNVSFFSYMENSRGALVFVNY